MKFYRKISGEPMRFTEKAFLIMRLIIVILTAAILQVSASTKAQKVTIQAKHETLENVLKALRLQTGYDYVADEKLLDQAKDINVVLKNIEYDEALKQIFINQNLAYTFDNKVLSIKKKEQTFFEKLKSLLTAIDVIGRILDENGSPITGANISVKNGKQATSTDQNGYFRLENVNEGSVIVITFIGYDKKEITAAKNIGNIKLTTATSKLDEIQIQAYGMTSRRLSTSNIVTIKAAEIEKQPVNNPLLAMMGRVPGLEITQNNGLPGTGITVRIQGQNSLNGGLDPLYVVDGVPYESQTLITSGFNSPQGGSGSTIYSPGGTGNPLSYLNPYDIESIDVLKDADGTAIYGSRAANGAILITTKKGKNGPAKVDFNLQEGIGNVTKRLDLLNSLEYVSMRKEALRNENTAPNADNAYDILNLYGWDASRTKDWQKFFLGGTSNYTNAAMSISGGGVYSQYLIGGNFYRETTISPGNAADLKGSAHFNFNTTSQNEKLKFSLTGSYMLDNNKLQALDLVGLAINTAPTAPDLYKNDGSINWGTDVNGNSTFNNPLAQLNNIYQSKTSNLISSVNLNYRVSSDLRLSIQGGFTITHGDDKSIQPKSAIIPENRIYGDDYSTFGDNNILSAIVEPQLNYDANIGAGKLNALIGVSYLQRETNGKIIQVNGYSSDQLTQDPGSGSSSFVLGSTQSVYKYTKIFGRLNYNIKNKYLLNFTISRDGTSRFGPESRFHTFTALGAGWVFSEEHWFKKNQNSALSFGKIKISYGTTGSDQIGDYSYYDLYGSQGAAVPYQGLSALAVNGLYNPYRHWEESRKLNAGVDLGFFNDRILLSFNYARNRSYDQLSTYALPYTTGFSTIIKNLNATIQNTSLECALSTENIVGKNFKWNTNLNFSVPNNKVINFDDLDKSSANFWAIGKPVDYRTSLYYRFAGIDPETGRYLFYAANGGLTTTPASNTDQQYISTAVQWSGGISNSINYKSFEFSFFLQFVKKRSLGYFITGDPIGALGLNMPKTVLNHWQTPGDISEIGSFSTSTTSRTFNGSDANVIDGSYLRLKNVSLACNLPPKFALKNAKIFLNAQNVFVLTKYNGLDPETYLGVPPLRVIMMGLKFGL